MTKAKKLRVGTAAGALLAAVALGAVGAEAKVADQKAGDTAVITMEQEGKNLFFQGPASVSSGAKLKLVNNTNPKKIGPHTFSLAKPNVLPESKSEIKACERKFAGICGAIIKWHKVDLDTGAIGRNPSEAGKKGWDKEGSLKVRGDSYVLEKRHQKFAQKVSADPGTTLTFICAVHAGMQGTIDVTE